MLDTTHFKAPWETEIRATFKDIALAMVALGVSVIPLHEKSKNPCTEHAALDATRDTAQIEKWNRQNLNFNIGCVATNNTVWMLDDDTGEVTNAYEKETGVAFPSTFAVCSSGVKRHYYFKQTDASRRMGNVDYDVNGKEMFSARVHNKYVVGAGSIHPITGKPYVVVNDFPIAPAPDSLVEWILQKTGKRTGGLVLKAPYQLPEVLTEGTRNKDLFRFASSLRAKGAGEVEILSALEATNKARCTPPLSASDLKTITASVMKYEAGSADSTPEEELEEPEVEAACEEPLPEFPVVSGSLHDFATTLDPDLPYSFKIMSAGVRVGLALSGFVQLAGESNIQPRFFAVMVSEPWRGKTAANEQTGALLNQLFDSASQSSMDSGPALVSTFKVLVDTNKRLGLDSRAPVKLLLDPDEVKDLFEKAKESKDSRNSLFGELLKLYENNRTANCTKKDGNIIIENAHLAVMGGATPASYEQMWMKTGGGSDGLQSRFTVVGTNPGSLPIKRRESDPAALADTVSRINTQVRAAIQNHVQITIAPDAYTMLTEWWEPIKGDRHASRLPDIIKRFLMVLAVTNDTLTVDSSLMAVGIAFGDHVLACRRRYNPDDAHSYAQAFENRIETCYRKHGNMEKRLAMRRINPAHYPGGYGAFKLAWQNLSDSERLIPRGSIGRKRIYGL